MRRPTHGIACWPLSRQTLDRARLENVASLPDQPASVRILAWALWALAAAWLVLAVSGALNFQELYGGTSGLQAFGVALVVALIPAAIGWWAYRRAKP